MRIGNCVIFRSVETIEDQLKNLIKCGMDNCQIVAWHPNLWTDENAQLLKRIPNLSLLKHIYVVGKVLLTGTFTAVS